VEHNALSVRPFIGAKDFSQSRRFYSAMGFTEVVISAGMSLFQAGDHSPGGGVAFYLQDAYVQDWVDNTMLFLEVRDVDCHLADLLKLGLPDQFPGVRISGIRVEAWGKEYFLHDPSGILWHIGQFGKGQFGKGQFGKTLT